MGHLEVSSISFTLPDGRPLLSDVSLRVGEGAKVALIGPNGAGKTTLCRIIAGEVSPSDGAVTRQRRARRDASVHRQRPGPIDRAGPAAVRRSAADPARRRRQSTTPSWR